MLTNAYNQDTSITGHLKWSQIKEVPLYVHVSHVPTTVDCVSPLVSLTPSVDFSWFDCITLGREDVVQKPDVQCT